MGLSVTYWAFAIRQLSPAATIGLFCRMSSSWRQINWANLRHSGAFATGNCGQRAKTEVFRTFQKLQPAPSSENHRFGRFPPKLVTRDPRWEIVHARAAVGLAWLGKKFAKKATLSGADRVVLASAEGNRSVMMTVIVARVFANLFFFFHLKILNKQLNILQAPS